MEEAGEKGSVRSSGGGGSGRGVLWEMDVEVVMALRTLESVEKDACALSNSLSALLASLESALSKVTTSSVQHLQVYNEGSGRVQEAGLQVSPNHQITIGFTREIFSRNTFKGTRYKPNESNKTTIPDLEYPVRKILKADLKLNLED